MKNFIHLLIRTILLLAIWLIWWWAMNVRLSVVFNLTIIIGGVLLTYPAVWLGRKILDKNPSAKRAEWVTTFVHYTLGFTFGLPIIRAMVSHQEWTGWKLPIPEVIGLWLVILTGAACALTVINLALKGLGAPFAIALTRKLAVGWMYSRTRNPMVLTALALLISLGIWFQSLLFVLWGLFVFSPALLIFIKKYEERELELRFGASYLDYKSKTPMLFPRKTAH